MPYTTCVWVFNNKVLIQFGVIKNNDTTLPIAYSNINYKIYLGFIAGIDGNWFSSNKTITSFTQYIKYYGINNTLSSTNNYYLTIGV